VNTTEQRAAETDRVFTLAWQALTGRDDEWGGCAERDAVGRIAALVFAREALWRERAEAAGALLAGLAESTVPKTWDGLLELLNSCYPEEVFPARPDDPSGDPGSRIVSLIRHLEATRAQSAEFRARGVGEVRVVPSQEAADAWIDDVTENRVRLRLVERLHDAGFEVVRKRDLPGGNIHDR
jgi:hypothetical protein